MSLETGTPTQKGFKHGDKMAGTGLLVGLDIGGTKTEVLVVDHDLNQLSRLSTPTKKAIPADVLAGTTDAIFKALALAQGTADQITGIGIAMPGLVNRENGLVKLAVNLGLESYPLGRLLSEQLKAPTFIDNDVRVAAMGAYNLIRKTEEIEHLAYLSIGTGISAGVILEGRLYRGANGMAGEIGHVILDPNGPRCSCGLYGCLEAMAAGPAIARLGLERMVVTDGEGLTAGDVYRAARQGDPQAQAIVKQVSRYLSRGIQMLIMAYDVERVALGGGVTKTGAIFLDPILSELAHLRTQSQLAKALLVNSKVSMLPADYNPGIWGAAALAYQFLVENNH